MVVLGGATTVSGLLNLGIINELWLMANPLLLGGGKALFRDVQERRELTAPPVCAIFRACLSAVRFSSAMAGAWEALQDEVAQQARPASQRPRRAGLLS